MRNKNINWFEGKLSQVLSKNPNISDINELAILALRNQRHTDLNEFYLDCALVNLRADKGINIKKVIWKKETLKPISLAA